MEKSRPWLVASFQILDRQPLEDWVNMNISSYSPAPVFIGPLFSVLYFLDNYFFIDIDDQVTVSVNKKRGLL